MSEFLVEQSRRAARKYYETGDPKYYEEKMRWESIDGDPVPDYIEDIDLNPCTNRWRFNYPYEVYIIGNSRNPYYPYA